MRNEVIPDCTEMFTQMMAYLMVSLIAAKAYFFCLRHKRNKKASHPECFFAHQALTLQNEQNLGWNLLPCFARSWPLRFCKISLCPATAQGHHRSARFHPKLPG